MDIFNQFYSWLFDGNENSDIPEEILSYNSPITQTYVISLFTKLGSFNHFLDSYFNNIGVYYLDRLDLFMFIKRCVNDFKINKNQIRYSWFGKKSNLFKELSKKHSNLKPYEISILCKIVDKLEDRDIIYSTLGITKDKIIKNKISNNKNKILVSKFISENFELERT
jgi:hypothetical protein